MNFSEKLAVSYPQVVQSIFNGLRRVIKNVLPDSREVMIEGGKEVGYLIPGKGCIIKIVPMDYWVRLSFTARPRLTDPYRMLQGKATYLPYVEVPSMVVATSLELKQLVQEAWEDGLRKPFAKPR